MSRIADEQRGRGHSRSNDRLAERREALRRAVSDLGDVTSRFRARLEEEGHAVPRPPELNGASAPPAPPVAPDPASEPGAPTASALPADGDPAARRDAAMAEARMRFESVQRQADELVRTITEAVRSETNAFRANIEVGAEARFHEVEIEAQRRMRRAQAEADAIVEQRRRRIAEVSDRILELGESLAGRLSDADEVKGQFDIFVQALGQASDRLAAESRGASWSAAAGTISELAPRLANDPPAGLAEAA